MSRETQEQRLRYALDLFAGHARRFYDENGRFHASEPGVGEPDDRDRGRTAMALLAHGGEPERRIAEALIGRLFVADGVDRTTRSWRENFDEAAPPGAQAKDWNIFHSNNACKMLKAHGHRLEAGTRAKLERIATRNAQRYAGSAQADYLPHGFNDNMPAGALCGLILGGEAIGDDRAVADGAYRLELFAEQLSRRGLVSEHSSGTYTPITVSEIAEVAEHSDDAELRRLARDCEARLWADLLLTYHPPTAQFAGASTRSYAVNSVGHCDGAACVVWVGTGLPEAYCPLDFGMARKPGQITHFGDDAWKTFTGRAAVLARFHCPDWLAEAARDRAYPFRFAATAEHGAETTEAAVMQVTQQPRYALGTRTAMFLDGKQTEIAKAVFARRRRVRDFADTGTLCTRFLVNDVAPGDPEDATARGVLGGNYGTARAIQHEGLGLVASRAGKPQLDASAFAGCRRIRQTALISAHFGGAERIRCGEEEIEALPWAAGDDRPVCLDLGPVYLALTPLTMTRLERRRAIAIEQRHGFLTISFHNYDGEARDFTDQELARVFNGFVLELADADEHASFEAFAAQAGPDVVEDWWFVGTRRTRIRKDGRELALLWHTEANRLKAATVDGTPVGETRLAADGLDETRLPFMRAAHRPRRFGAPEESLDVAWYPEIEHLVAPYTRDR